MDAISLVLGLIVGFLPLALIVIATKNRKAWHWWYRTRWKGSIILSLANMASKVLGSLAGYSIWSSGGSQAFDNFGSILRLLNFPDIVTLQWLSALAQRFAGDQYGVYIPWPIYVVVDFLLVYLGFSLLWSCKAHFARKAYEID